MVINSLPTPQLSLAIPSFPPVIASVYVRGVSNMAQIVAVVVDD
jgi:hypothetical protein